MKIYPKFTQKFEADKADNSTSRTNRNTMFHMMATTYPGAYKSYSKRPHHSIASGAAHVLIIGFHCGRGRAPISKKNSKFRCRLEHNPVIAYICPCHQTAN